MIPKNMFAFYLPSVSGKKGQLVLGGMDDNHYTGDMTWVPLSSETYWEVQADSIGVADLSSSCKTVILDTGTSLLAGPKDEIDKFAASIGLGWRLRRVARYVPKCCSAGAFQSPIGGVYVMSCSKAGTLPDFEVTLAGRKFVVHGEQYIMRVKMFGFPICILGMMGIDVPAPRGPLWILGHAPRPASPAGPNLTIPSPGDTFIRQYYSVFDVDGQRIGLATVSK